MGKDNKGIAKRRTDRKTCKSPNAHLLSLSRLYRFLARRTSSKFNARVQNRLMLSRTNRATMSISRIVKFSRGSQNAGKVIVVPTAVLDDVRLPTVPKMRICALRFSKMAARRIEGAGGECLTFDQFAAENPTGSNTVLLRGRKSRREVIKSYGAAGVPGSHTKPKCTHKKNERGRGRRRSREWKVKSFKYAQK
ncbi:large subunit ribosomal protein L18e [Perkinsela sp. CCAP 1560/4]|nr:large subunit ribosomal protein L18e [Perkinsela sp. CCAP 1560/4]|eukprot:KNH03797.1 large subunit ribosomal protein L18e [Perkinsela sp. CCAP 1560/4]